jgi:hypothetical protein
MHASVHVKVIQHGEWKTYKKELYKSENKKTALNTARNKV